MIEAIVYSILFMTLYFQVFALLTFVDRAARERRLKVHSGALPLVAVIVPCWNEGTTIGGTIASLKLLDYPEDRLSFILVNDGSTDNTREVMDAYANDPQISVIHMERNGGKHTAMNAGIASTNAEFVGCLDADSFVHPGALKEIVAHFDDPQVAAVTASMSVHNPHTILEHMQAAEYLMGIALRHIFASVNGLYVTPGPFSFYRRSVIADIGGFRHAHQTEDMEMAMRIQREGYRIENAPRAQVFTKAPRTLRGLIKQRTRWTSGFMRNAWDYRTLMLNPKHGVLGLLVMPLGIVALVAALARISILVYETIDNSVQTIATIGDVPLSHLVALPRFDWFYFPITELALLGVVCVGIVLATMIIGKRISGTEASMSHGFVWYLVAYSFIAPLWVLRSTYDVAVGRVRSWR